MADHYWDHCMPGIVSAQEMRYPSKSWNSSLRVDIITVPILYVRKLSLRKDVWGEARTWTQGPLTLEPMHGPPLSSDVEISPSALSSLPLLTHLVHSSSLTPSVSGVFHWPACLLSLLKNTLHTRRHQPLRTHQSDPVASCSAALPGQPSRCLHCGLRLLLYLLAL